MTKDIYINTNSTQGYSGVHYINVTKDDPWDPLSKIFKMYTHTIIYTGSGYHAFEYTINVFARGSRNPVFIYKNPSQKVEKAEVYFKGDHNIRTEDPLAVGFIYQGNTKYYTWSKLKSTRNSTGTITDVDSIGEKDLVTVLLEELGTSIHRPRKLVIRLGEKPDRGREVLQYPDSGYYSELNRKITVRKVEGSRVPGVEGYEHTISSSIGSVSDFYVSYLNNSRYFESESRSRGHYLLEKVTAYFKNGSKNLVLIMFTLTSRSTYVYTYSDFVQDLKTDPSEVKKINQSLIINPDISLIPILKKESERLTPLIEFKKGDGTDGNKNVTRGIEQNVGPDTVRQGYTFKKVSMTPDASYGDKPDGSLGGPWIVYNNYLFDNYDSATITNEDLVLTPVITSNGNNTKYTMITVYYSTKSNEGYDSNRKALLVEFVPGPGLSISNFGSDTKLYIKRRNKDGKTWANESSRNIGTSVNETLLTRIARDSGIIVVSPGSPGGGGGEAVGSTGDREKQKGDKNEDDSISKLKLAGAGVATTAIGAGAIGGGAHYAHGVLSVIQWLI